MLTFLVLATVLEVCQRWKVKKGRESGGVLVCGREGRFCSARVKRVEGKK